MIWENFLIFIICVILWTIISSIFFPRTGVWIDVVAGMIIMTTLMLLGYPLTQ